MDPKCPVLGVTLEEAAPEDSALQGVPTVGAHPAGQRLSLSPVGMAPAEVFGWCCGKSIASPCSPAQPESPPAGKALSRFGKLAGRAGDALPAPCLPQAMPGAAAPPG